MSASDMQALRDLAACWREVSHRNRYEKDSTLRGGDPGPHITAIQLEWAAREIERLREQIDNARDFCVRPDGTCLPASDGSSSDAPSPSVGASSEGDAECVQPQEQAGRGRQGGC